MNLVGQKPSSMFFSHSPDIPFHHDSSENQVKCRRTFSHGIFVTHQNFNTGEDRPRLSIFSIHVTFSNLFKCFTLYIRFVTQNICLYIFLRIFRAKLSLCNNENSKIIILIYYRKKNSKIIILIYYRTNEKLLYNRIYLF